MKFLDTSFLVDYLKGKEYTVNYLEENSEEAFYTSTISLFELFRGEMRSEGSNNIKELKENIGWLNSKELEPGAAEEAARIEKELEEKGKRINLADVLIAGSAQQIGAEIVTGDSDFEKIPGIETAETGK